MIPSAESDKGAVVQSLNAHGRRRRMCEFLSEHGSSVLPGHAAVARASEMSSIIQTLNRLTEIKSAKQLAFAEIDNRWMKRLTASQVRFRVSIHKTCREHLDRRHASARSARKSPRWCLNS